MVLEPLPAPERGPGAPSRTTTWSRGAFQDHKAWSWTTFCSPGNFSLARTFQDHNQAVRAPSSTTNRGPGPRFVVLETAGNCRISGRKLPDFRRIWCICAGLPWVSRFSWVWIASHYAASAVAAAAPNHAAAPAAAAAQASWLKLRAQASWLKSTWFEREMEIMLCFRRWRTSSFLPS